ncbi:hypothetical protein EJ04DRAFT_516393 [Polyplosphaeria fusca]|uniref:Uncharacterized protein n=1 Tax=Polyplosphaeria fusca TaxID=682080 RepID=A0A9P4UY14_9PLEO|nr:hypothetical protein EJ04DRAFT_516393 [Polyplosphaeria fusca]
MLLPHANAYDSPWGKSRSHLLRPRIRACLRQARKLANWYYFILYSHLSTPLVQVSLSFIYSTTKSASPY